MATRGLVGVLAILAGCAKPLPPEPVRVEVPVAYCPAPPATPLPELPLAALPADATPEQIARAYAETVVILRREVLIREAALDGYREKD